MNRIRAYKRAVFAGHREATARDNLSTSVLAAAFDANGRNYIQAVIAALGTVGGKHGPIRQAHDLFLIGPSAVDAFLSAGMMVPGWGSSFAKGKPDPIWAESHKLLGDIPHDEPSLFVVMNKITKTLHERGKMVYPNAAAYTACLSILMGLPSALSPSLFIEARAEAWRCHILNLMNPKG